ncbi:MAG: DUF1294 domain-containing protein [Bacillota bacterium]|jgi:uncharacterized membrane protein YsdA (DUF1294 family)
MRLIILGLLFIIFNLVGMIVVAVDKQKAVWRRRRIPERVFFIMAALGACPGIYGGCLLFRHKTKHKSFMWGLPVIFILQAAAIGWVCFWIGQGHWL